MARSLTARLQPLPALRAAAWPSALWLDLLVLAPILAVALGTRLINLDAYSGLFDEGIRGEQLFLMSAGYRPFRDIFAAQGPLLLDLLYPWFVLFGEDLPAARMAVGVYSVIGLVGAYWVGRLAGGRIGGVATALLLVLSPLYLEGSRLALAEVPALAPATLAVGAALVYGQRGRRRWLVASAVLMTVSLLIKPITLAVGVPVGLAILGRLWTPVGEHKADRRLFGVSLAQAKSVLLDLVLVAGIVIVLSTIVVLAVGLAGVIEQIWNYRVESRDSEGWSLRKNVAALTRALAFEPAGLPWLAAGGALMLLLTRRWTTFCVAVWALAAVGVLLFYSPLHGKHAVTMILPLVVAAGAGLGAAWRIAQGGGPTVWRGLAGAGALGLLLLYLAGTPSTIAAGGEMLRVTADTDVDPAIEQYADAVATIAALSGPADFIVTDHPYLTFLAQRLVPPALVDTSKSRIRSRSLRASEAVAISAAYDPTLVVLWSDRLRPLRDFKEWVEVNYRLAKVYNRRQDLDRTIYVRRNADMPAVRAMLTDDRLVPLNADFGGLRLVSAGLDRSEIRLGDGAGLTLQWEATAPISADLHAVIVLRGPDGQAYDQQQESLSGGSIGTSEWDVGRWLFQNSFVQTMSDEPLPLGEYTVGVSAYDSRARRMIPLPDGRDEQIVGTLNIVESMR